MTSSNDLSLTQMCRDLVLSPDYMVEVSPAVPVGGANAVQADFTAISVTGEVTVQLQQSDDAENWLFSDSQQSATADGFYQLPLKASVGTKFVRLRYSAEAESVGVLAARLHLLHL